MGVLAEILLFAASARLPLVVTPLRLIGVGAAGALLRWSGMATSPPVLILFLLQALHGLSFGATFLVRSRSPRGWPRPAGVRHRPARRYLNHLGSRDGRGDDRFGPALHRLGKPCLPRHGSSRRRRGRLCGGREPLPVGEFKAATRCMTPAFL